MKINNFKKIAVANRGEIAVRIISACKDLGIKTVLLYAEPDSKQLAFRLSDEQICIGPEDLKKSYLDPKKIVEGALATECDALHPGVGFLSENFELASLCKKKRISFIGPSIETMKLFGNKVKAKKFVNTLNIPTIPGCLLEGGEKREVLKEKISRIGLPVLVKNAGGGGGRGIKKITSWEDMEDQISSSRREGLSSFGTDEIFIEKFFEKSRHIEVQIFGDASGFIYHLGTRDCSLQRNHQKIIEEAPSTAISPKTLSQVMSAAVQIAKGAKYKGAGTVEFLVSGEEYYFLEVNTRLQVEHTVTEMVYGVDLVKAQIHTAEGAPLQWEQKNLSPKGVAIECRICSEDPYRKGVLSTGKITFCKWPQGQGRRLDIGVDEGDEITPYYDSLIGKIIVWDETRTRALQKMVKTLEQTIIFGVKTNIPLLIDILKSSDFISGNIDTSFFERNYQEGLQEKNKNARESLREIIDKIGLQKSENLHKNPWLERYWR